MIDDAASADLSERAPRGRPRDLGKRQALIAAARELFIAQGFDAVTTDQIIAKAHVSRATFYSHFHDKSELLEAMVSAESRRIGADDFPEDIIAGGLEAALTALGERLLSFLANPDMLALERLMASAARNVPDLGHRLFVAGPGRARESVIKALAAAQADGLIGACDLEAAVWDLMGLWQGMLRVELNFGERQAPDQRELRARAERGVAQFMKLYGTGSAAPR